MLQVRIFNLRTWSCQSWDTWTFWRKLPFNLTKKGLFQNRMLTSPFSLHLFYNQKPSITIGSLRNYDSSKQYYLLALKKFRVWPLIIPQEFLISTESVDIDLDSNPSKVSQPCRQLSNVFDHPLNDKALKTYNVFASQDCNHSKLLFLTRQSNQNVFFSKKQNPHFPKSACYARVTS